VEKEQDPLADFEAASKHELRRYGRVIHLYSPEVLQVRNSI
jgi:hypothetical protein